MRQDQARRTRPFDLIVTFLSFIFALALAHLLLAAINMIQHRRTLTFDWAHGLWMGAALVMLWANWISLWDLHATQGRTYIGAFLILSLMALPINYLGATSLNIANWTNQNGVVLAQLIPAAAAFIFRARWVQIAAPIAIISVLAVFMISFYWVLR